MKKRVVVVAPTFKEEDNIKGFIDTVLSSQSKLSNYDVHLLISDSHSPDKTCEIVKKKMLQSKKVNYLDVKKRGLGLGLSKGIDFAVNKLHADIVVTMEADLSCDPEQLPSFLSELETADVVLGSRYMQNGKITNWSWWRKLLSWQANMILRMLALNWNIHEFTNLYRAFSKKAWLTIGKKVSLHDDWIFVPAFVYEAIEQKLVIKEVPIVYFDRFGGRSKMRTISYTKNLLHYALRFRLKKIYGALS